MPISKSPGSRGDLLIRFRLVFPAFLPQASKVYIQIYIYIHVLVISLGLFWYPFLLLSVHLLDLPDTGLSAFASGQQGICMCRFFSLDVCILPSALGAFVGPSFVGLSTLAPAQQDIDMHRSSRMLLSFLLLPSAFCAFFLGSFLGRKHFFFQGEQGVVPVLGSSSDFGTLPFFLSPKILNKKKTITHHMSHSVFVSIPFFFFASFLIFSAPRPPPKVQTFLYMFFLYYLPIYVGLSTFVTTGVV